MKPIHLFLLPALGALAHALCACAAESVPAPRVAAQASAPGAASSSTESAAQLLQAIRNEIGDAACVKDQQCVSVAIGAKPCGGPETYFAWSITTGDRARLVSLVMRHRDARVLENERSGMSSDCRVVQDPGAVCRPRVPDGKRVCQSGQGGQARLD